MSEPDSISERTELTQLGTRAGARIQLAIDRQESVTSFWLFAVIFGGPILTLVTFLIGQRLLGQSLGLLAAGAVAIALVGALTFHLGKKGGLEASMGLVSAVLGEMLTEREIDPRSCQRFESGKSMECAVCRVAKAVHR